MARLYRSAEETTLSANQTGQDFPQHRERLNQSKKMKGFWGLQNKNKVIFVKFHLNPNEKNEFVFIWVRDEILSSEFLSSC